MARSAKRETSEEKRVRAWREAGVSRRYETGRDLLIGMLLAGPGGDYWHTVGDVARAWSWKREKAAGAMVRAWDNGRVRRSDWPLPALTAPAYQYRVTAVGLRWLVTALWQKPLADPKRQKNVLGAIRQLQPRVMAWEGVRVARPVPVAPSRAQRRAPVAFPVLKRREVEGGS